VLYYADLTFTYRYSPPNSRASNIRLIYYDLPISRSRRSIRLRAIEVYIVRFPLEKYIVLVGILI